jgi:MipA family protein
MGLAGRRFAIAVLLALVPVASAPGMAAAADLQPPPPMPAPPPNAPVMYTPVAPPGPDWIVTIGGEARAIPAWPGAPTNKYQLIGFPLLALQKPGDPPFFFGARDGFGVPILDLGTFQLGPVGKIDFPRYQGQYQQLNGLGEVGWALELGGYAIYWPLPWLRLRGEVRQGIGGETGVTGDFFMDAVVPVGQWRLSGGPRITAESTQAVSPYFSISAAQAAASGVSGLPPLTAYSATGGVYSYGAGGQVEYFWNRQWSTHAIVEYQRISGSAADSPLVTMRGSPNQFTFGLGATYTFATRPLVNLHGLW